MADPRASKGERTMETGLGVLQGCCAGLPSHQQGLSQSLCAQFSQDQRGNRCEKLLWTTAQGQESHDSDQLHISISEACVQISPAGPSVSVQNIAIASSRMLSVGKLVYDGKSRPRVTRKTDRYGSRCQVP